MHLRHVAAVALLSALLGPIAAPVDAKPTRTKSRPDLAVTAVTKVPQQAAAGARFSAQVLVTNKGSAGARATPVELLLSRDARRSADDMVAGRARVPALKARARVARPVTVQMPATATGRYRVVVCLKPKKPARSKAERRNDCEVGPYLSVEAKTEPELPWASAQLTGEIELRQSGHTDDGTRDHTWDRAGDVQLSFAVAAPSGKPTMAEFTDVGSSYAWSGAETIKDGGDQCTFWKEELEDGKGPLAGRATARFVEGTGENAIELSLTLPYHVNGTTGADCRPDHTYAEDRVNTTVLRFDLKGTGEDDVSHYVASVTPPAGSIWHTVSAVLDLKFQRRPR